MKANPINALLDECRAGKASDDHKRSVERIDQKILSLQDERAMFSVQLQETIADGSDAGKLHTVLAQINENLANLEAARAVFSRRQEEAAALEYDAETRALLDQREIEAQEVAAAAKEFAAHVAKARAGGAKLAEATKRHDRSGTKLEARKVRPGLPASAIIRNTIGEVPRGDGVTEYGRRLDIGFAEILADNPSIMRRAQILRRGRVGETNQARDMATEGWMKLANGQG
jgi:hypothetical protein